ncbi:diaminopimelate decarboxylase [Metabacillus sp. B2-18]|uniref:diaminopimelate decarboxylase n=1 Tax=Metabacillus sp. B2-18 TaxID=2897333 RepID=UPI001E6107FB|nr:diaminopimelate decarboxylase [Metabacillus sp. B2-18]UGB29485.1 diaminopimelate decarboxylase [Metabacillus sp. B2-18]
MYSLTTNENKELEFQTTIEDYLFNVDKSFEFRKDYGSSFFILDVKKLQENYKKIHNAFKKKYDNFIIAYSYKTNYLPYLCKELSRCGAYSEVVSRLEYDLAIKIGIDPKRIVFNGPLKSQEDIDYALENESKVNLDSIYEFNFVKEYCDRNPNKQVKIGLRINFDIWENSINLHTDDYKISRFGICVENGNLKYAINEITQLKNVKIVGLHAHFSTRQRSVETYSKITQGLCKAAKENNLTDIEYIDIGGGISGEVPKSLREHAPTFDEYAEAVGAIMNEEFSHYQNKPTLILEPGISMVANAFVFVTRVIDVKKIRDKVFVLVDGSAHNIKPTLHQKNLPMKILKQQKIDNPSKQKYNIVGYTCMEQDYLATNCIGEIPQRDDYIMFDNVGAYTIVFNPPFIKERPAILAYDQNDMCVVRRKETFRQFFNEEIYCF